MESHAIIKLAKSDVERIDKLKMSLETRNQFADEYGAALEALEFLRVKIQSIIVKETVKKNKGGSNE
jgi:hypothetical protein